MTDWPTHDNSTKPPLGRRLKGAMSRLPGMMTCREFEDFIDAYLDGTLPICPRMRFRAHLIMCRECRSYIAAYKRTLELGKSAFDDPDAAVTGLVPDELMNAILASRTEPKP